MEENGDIWYHVEFDVKVPSGMKSYFVKRLETMNLQNVRMNEITKKKEMKQ